MVITSETNSEENPCACLQNFYDLMRAATPKNNLLRKIICAGCGKTIWINRETKYCSNCAAKIGKETQSNR